MWGLLVVPNCMFKAIKKNNNNKLHILTYRNATANKMKIMMIVYVFLFFFRISFYSNVTMLSLCVWWRLLLLKSQIKNDKRS